MRFWCPDWFEPGMICELHSCQISPPEIHADVSAKQVFRNMPHSVVASLVQVLSSCVMSELCLPDQYLFCPAVDRLGRAKSSFISRFQDCRWDRGRSAEKTSLAATVVNWGGLGHKDALTIPREDDLKQALRCLLFF